MAESDPPIAAEGSPQATPRENAFSTPFSQAAIHEEDEVSDEWEYEYSATETETYYITLDLTTPDHQPKRSGPIGRQPKARWLNPGLNRSKRGNKITKPPTYSAVAAQANKEAQAEGRLIPDDEPAEAEDEDGDEEEMPNKRRKQEEPKIASSKDVPKEDSDQPSKVQILDLHTANPIVSYDGKMFSCQWSTNIGTELLFTAHDKNSNLPYLRTLTGGVDLLAASSARLVSNPMIIEPKQDARTSDQAVTRQTIDVRELAIPVGRQASQKRKEQANFLESLIKAKQDKGEEDHVTVFAQKRNTNTAWRKEMKRKRLLEKEELLALVGRISEKSGPSAPMSIEQARDKLREMDEEDERMAAVDRARGIGPDGTKLKRTGPKTGGRKKKNSNSSSKGPDEGLIMKTEVDGSMPASAQPGFDRPDALGGNGEILHTVPEEDVSGAEDET